MGNNRYENLAQATEDLIKEGYTINFRVNDEGKLVDNKQVEFYPSQVKLNEFHRFEGISNPADMSILYAVETDSGLKGLVVDAFGADGSEITSDFMNKAKQNQYD
ncbi:MAG: phosphoribosylpyrophosphate synthetase [bacterium]